MSNLIIQTDKNDKLCMSFRYHPDILEAIKTIPTRKWDALSKVHYIGKHDVDAVVNIFKSFGYEIQFSPRAEEILKDYFDKKNSLITIKTIGWTPDLITKYNEKLKLKLPLRPFQIIGHKFLRNSRSCLLVDEMGLGKTIQVISTFKTLKEEGRVFKMLVLCPASVKGAWVKDIVKFTDLKYQLVEGNFEARKKLYANGYDILIMSYDTYLTDFGVKDKPKNEDKVKERLPVPMIDVLCCDECQRLVRVKNKTTQSIYLLKQALDLKYIYLLTGTPIINRIEDLWSLLHIVDPEIVGEFWQFRNRYCEMVFKEITMLDKAKRKMGIFEKITKKIPKVVGYKNLDELKVKIDPYYIRREKKEVLTDLPDKIFETYELELTNTQRKFYNFLKNDFFNQFKGADVSVANVLVWFIRAKQLCDSVELLDPELRDSSKMKEMKDLLEDLIDNDNHKVVLFSQYKEMTDILVREFQKYNPIYLHGKVKDSDRPLLIDAFQEDLAYKLFISTLRAGGLGITLTAADIVIQYDKWFSPAANNQAVDRVHRIGQDKPVTVIDFICKDTIEERIERILERKKKMFEGIFGEDESVLSKLTSDELKELL